MVLLLYLYKILSFTSLQTCSQSYLIGPAQHEARSFLGIRRWWSFVCRLGEHHEAEKSDISLLDLIMKYETLILIFVRAYRERDFCMFVEQLVPFFFALDHINYTRWWCSWSNWESCSLQVGTNKQYKIFLSKGLLHINATLSLVQLKFCFTPVYTKAWKAIRVFGHLGSGW